MYYLLFTLIPIAIILALQTAVFKPSSHSTEHSATMAGELILLTGSTGHLGYKTLIEALSKGYKVRATVRSDAKAEEVKAARSTQPYLSQLTFVTVPDIEKRGAFDEAVKDVNAIIHFASPLAKPSDDPEKTIIQPAINGTLSILYSALKEHSVKRVVITSSVAAVRPSSAKVFTPDNIEADPVGPYNSYFEAYGASKKLAYARTRDFVAEEKPNFSIINIMPSFVIGKNELATTPETVVSGSNALIMSALLGQQNPTGMIAGFAHVDDVAFVHVAALNPDIKGNRNYGVHYDYTKEAKFDDAIDVVKKWFPDAVADGILRLGGSTTSHLVPFDVRNTEEELGYKQKTFEEMVKNQVSHYIEVSKNVKAKA